MLFFELSIHQKIIKMQRMDKLKHWLI